MASNFEQEAPLDTTTEVVTPENIAFEYQLAGPVRRLPAFVFDVFLYSSVLVMFAILGICAGILTFSDAVLSIWIFSFLVLWFVLGWFYGALFETFYNGVTPGKYICGLRVIGVNGRPLSGTQATLRNLLRVTDLAPYTALGQIDFAIAPAMIIPTGLIGLATVILTRRMQRLGDLAAGTMVVVDEKSWRLPTTKVDDLRAIALASHIPADFVVHPSMAKTLAAYAERRAFLTPARRREIAKHVSGALIERFEFRRDIDPDLLLYALYYRTFLAADDADPVPLGNLAHASPLRKDM